MADTGQVAGREWLAKGGGRLAASSRREALGIRVGIRVGIRMGISSRALGSSCWVAAAVDGWPQAADRRRYVVGGRWQVAGGGSSYMQ